MRLLDGCVRTAAWLIGCALHIVRDDEIGSIRIPDLPAQLFPPLGFEPEYDSERLVEEALEGRFTN
jgi:hypothetical protein